MKLSVSLFLNRKAWQINLGRSNLQSHTNKMEYWWNCFRQFKFSHIMFIVYIWGLFFLSFWIYKLQNHKYITLTPILISFYCCNKSHGTMYQNIILTLFILRWVWKKFWHCLHLSISKFDKFDILYIKIW